MKIFRISIPLLFNDVQPSSFGVNPASSQPFQSGHFIGSVEQGGSCNCEEYHIIPHCQGTHTESIAHIVKDKIPVWQVVPVTPIRTLLITVQPIPLSNTSETYSEFSSPDDFVIISDNIPEIPKNIDALIIRTLPNDNSKKHQQWGNSPYFTKESMEKIANQKITHVLVDFPSVDRADDGGELINHRLWWNIPLKINELTASAKVERTISEMIFVDSDIPDGVYSLQMMVPHFETDAAPSQLILFTE